MESAAGFVIQNRERKFLLVKRDRKPGIPHPGAWVFPGGGIEGNEAPADAAIREMAEEFGMHVRAEDLNCIGEYMRSDGVRCHIFMYQGAEIPGPVQEGEETKWFSLEEVRALSLGFEQNRHLVPLLTRSSQ